MMNLAISHDDVENFFVDRTGIADGDTGRQGLYVGINGLRIEFADEDDAVRVARRMLQRLGEAWTPPPILGVQRSPKWEKVRAEHLKTQPACQFCGVDKSVEVHHVLPFHLFPHMELDPTNLLTLCGHSALSHCHLIVGHFGNWSLYNPAVAEVCRVFQDQRSRYGKG